MKFGSLFSGIGGMDLGLERAGMKCVWQVEIDEYASKVLAKHWPDVRRYRDVREFPRPIWPEHPDAQQAASESHYNAYDPYRVDLICGGFPCQDISNAGKRAGIDGERSGLWSEFARIVRVLRPRYVLVENVAALLERGIERVLGDLAASGYDAEWDCIPAAAVGAPHRRDRVFIMAYPQQQRLSGRIFRCSEPTTILAAPRIRSRFGYDYGQAWNGEPDLAGMVHGLPEHLEPSIGLGNAVVPQVAEWIGRRIMEAAKG